MNQALAEVRTLTPSQPLTAGEIQQQVNTIQKVMSQVMKLDTHYGKIPGTNQPSLFKPGAEKIMATFRLSADPDVTDLSADDEIRYLVKVRLSSPSGVFVGAGIGECSTNEEKYKWRASVCEEEFEDTDIDRRREKWKKGWQGKPSYKLKQVRTEPSDLANTVLKMAKKRALVDATLTATAASDIFTQDIEDLPEEYSGDTTTYARKPNGVQSQEKPLDQSGQKVFDSLRETTSKGMDALIEKWKSLTDAERAQVGARFGELKKMASGS